MLYDTKWESKVAIAIEPWRQILLDAASLIERCGHTKKALSGNGYCIMGAVLQVSIGRPDGIAAFTKNPIAQQAFDAVRCLASRKFGYQHPVWYNDADNTTAQDVIGLLRTAAQEAA